MQASIFEKLAEHGVLGLLVFALGWFVLKLLRELRDERAARLVDVKQGFEVLSEIQIAASKQTETTAEVLHELKERRQEIERERNAERPRR